MLRHFPKLLFLTTLTLGQACGGAVEEPAERSQADAVAAAPERDPSCPARVTAPDPLPGGSADVASLDYWLKRAGKDADRPLMGLPALSAQGHALRRSLDGEPRLTDLQWQPPAEVWRKTLRERLAFMRDRVQSGEYTGGPDGLVERLSANVDGFAPAPALHVALETLPLRCGPFLEELRSTKADPRFDRNGCSVARAQEPVEVVGRVGGLRFVRTRYSVGFVANDAALSPVVSPQYEAAVRSGPRLQVLQTLKLKGQGSEQTLPPATLLPAQEGAAALLADDAGLSVTRPLSAKEAFATARVLTRRAFLTEAFRYLNTPYGWGGQGGGRDCSRLVMDVMRSFGLEMPRTSFQQSRLGRYAVEVPKEANETDRLALLDASQQRGVVLLHFPGHIMLYLGRDAGGVPRALHAFAEYMAPCASGKGETLFEVDRVAVTDLSLGQGSSRGSFLQRLTHLTVLGDAPGFELQAMSRFRAPAPLAIPVPDRCEDSLDAALFRSPRLPQAGQPVRVIAVTKEDTRPAGLILVDPDGKVHTPKVNELGVGPFGRWVELTTSRAGRWTAMLADGDRVLACERFGIRLRPEPEEVAPRTELSPAWEARWKWEADTENLFAAFVEQLFSHPVEDARTWSSLSELLADRERNLLHNHRGLGEDEALKLEPDCADLPYFLRAYFSWKVGLPFGYRRCSRGRAGTPPRCGPLIHNERPTPASNELRAFEQFVLRGVRPGVHSASGRTLPRAPQADLYSLPMSREAMKPGSVFIDPYGHLIVVAKWQPQGLGGAGMLLGADAQPDATVGRRRFWRGSFLFTPDTSDVGAGFKAFRPLERDPETEQLVALELAEVAKRRDFFGASMEQYQGDADQWYARMDGLIYPRALDAAERMTQLVNAFEEQVTRRVNSVDNGEGYLREHRGRIAMPEGTAIFQTEGAWEDYSTPSRDMRLLIALDTVQRLPERMRAAPERFGVPAAQAQERARALRASLDAELTRRAFAYTRSDGSSHTLSLADVVARAEAMEMAYNPNDCVEIRWGAAEGTPEYETCKRHAPAAQRAKMARYRPWFAGRARPAR